MNKITNTVWNGLPFNDFRNRFFIESWKEILYVNTPSFYQAKTMNVMSGAEEIKEAVDDYLMDEKNGKYILTLLKDYKEVLKNDKISKVVFPNIYKLFLKNTDIKQESLNYQKAVELRTISNLVLNKENEYFNELKKHLKNSILSTRIDLEHKDTITKDIYITTKIFIGYLLWKGYSPTYLFNRMEYLTRLKNYGKRDFRSQLNSCLDKITARISDYNVYFLVSPLSKYLLQSGNILDVEFLKWNGVITEDYYKKISQGVESPVVAKVIVNTTDYVSAAWKANEMLDKAIDFLGIEKPQYRFKYSQVCLTTFNSGYSSHQQTINIGRLKQFITSKDTGALENISEDIKLKFRQSIKLERYEVITRSLRYLRVAKESTSLEQKLLNLWIALECIFENTDGNIISGISEYVPIFYGSHSLSIRISYAKSLLEKRLIAFPNTWHSNVSDSSYKKFSQLSLQEFFDLMKVEKNRSDVFKELDLKGEQFVIFRIIHIFNCFKDSSSCKNRMENTKLDVENQLYRIYKVRNKLTHRAFYGNVRPQLIDHLLSYLLSSYNFLVSSCIYDDVVDFNSKDLFNIYKVAYNVMVDNLKESDKDVLEFGDFMITEQL